MRICHDPAFEAVIALYAVAQRPQIERLIQSKGLASGRSDFSNAVKALTSALPVDLLEQITHYFDLHGVGYVIYNAYFKYLAKSGQPPAPADFAQAVQSMTYEEALKYLAISNYGVQSADWKDKEAHALLSALLKAQGHPDPKRKKNLSALLKDKGYFLELLRVTEAFFIFYFKAVEPQNSLLALEAVSRYQGAWQESPDGFCKRFGVLPEEAQLSQIHISRFAPVGLTVYESKWQEARLYVLGALQDQVYSAMKPLEQMAYFHKALSDPKRIEMLQLLAHRAYFGQELAEALSIATSTTSYHINLLSDLGLLSSHRAHKRIYYRLDQTAYEDLLRRHHALLFSV